MGGSRKRRFIRSQQGYEVICSDNQGAVPVSFKQVTEEQEQTLGKFETKQTNFTIIDGQQEDDGTRSISKDKNKQNISSTTDSEKQTAKNGDQSNKSQISDDLSLPPHCYVPPPPFSPPPPPFSPPPPLPPVPLIGGGPLVGMSHQPPPPPPPPYPPKNDQDFGNSRGNSAGKQTTQKPKIVLKKTSQQNNDQTNAPQKNQDSVERLRHASEQLNINNNDDINNNNNNNNNNSNHNNTDININQTNSNQKQGMYSGSLPPHMQKNSQDFQSKGGNQQKDVSQNIDKIVDQTQEQQTINQHQQQQQQIINQQQQQQQINQQEAQRQNQLSENDQQQQIEKNSSLEQQLENNQQQNQIEQNIDEDVSMEDDFQNENQQMQENNNQATDMEVDEEQVQQQQSEQQVKGEEVTEGEGDDGDEMMEEEEDDGECPITGRLNAQFCFHCHDGGKILFCDGVCMRSFHVGLPEEEHELDELIKMERKKELADICNPLSLPVELYMRIEATTSNSFECPNCFLGKHKCWQCQSYIDMNQKDQGVKCIVGVCGKHYCKKCLDSKKVKLLDGVCPMHRCFVCDGGDDGDEPSDECKGPLLHCLCCPLAAHYNCAIQHDERYNEDGRCWTTWEHGLQFNVLYCLKHSITPDPYEIATKDMFDQWKYHLANQYPDIKWSRQVINEWERILDEKSIKEPTVASPLFQRKQKQSLELALLQDAGLIVSQEKIDKARQKIDDLLEAAKKEITITGIKDMIYKPTPYDKERHMKLPSQTSLQSYQNVANSLLQDQQNLNKEQLRARFQTVLSKQMLEEMANQYTTTRRQLEPFRHQNYTSYGRHFTREALIKIVAQKVAFFLEEDDVIVDFSCGANEWLVETKKAAAALSKKVRGFAVDIITPELLEDFHRKSWFEVLQNDYEQLKDSTKLVIGLNPPFGQEARLASQWVKHAFMEFKPRILVLIVPPVTRFPCSDIYETVYFDNELMRDRAFYRPGQGKSSHNFETPVFKILRRRPGV